MKYIPFSEIHSGTLSSEVYSSPSKLFLYSYSINSTNSCNSDALLSYLVRNVLTGL